MNRKQFSLRLPESLLEEIDRLAETELRDRTNYIEFVLTVHVEKKKQGMSDDRSEAKALVTVLHDQIEKISDEKIKRKLNLELLSTTMQMNDYLSPFQMGSMNTSPSLFGTWTLEDLQRRVAEHLD